MGILRALLRKSIGTIFVILGVMFAFSYLFQTLHPELKDPTKKWEKVEKGTGILYETPEAKDYINRVIALTKLLNDNSADVYRFLLMVDQQKISEDAVFAKKIIDKCGDRYLRITPSVLEKFVEEDRDIWNIYVLPNESKWNCEQWQTLKKEREAIRKEMLKLEAIYNSIPRKEKNQNT